MRKFLILHLCLILSTVAIGQIQTHEPPYSSKNDIEKQSLLRNFKIVEPSQSIASALAEDVVNAKKGLPPRFGLKMETNFNTEKKITLLFNVCPYWGYKTKEYARSDNKCFMIKIVLFKTTFPKF